MIPNHFLEDPGAEHYDRSRPYFHPLVFARLAQLLPAHILEQSLDIACGTGQSTEAMAGVSRAVVGLDASAAMLHQARRRGFRFVLASAEHLPFASNQFDLVGIGLAFHWFDRVTVLKEVRRVLKSGRWLFIFNSGFRGTMQGNDAFTEWHKLYLSRFPTPPRNSAPLPPNAIEEARFREVTSERFSHVHAYTREQLIAYLTTQTNVTAALSGMSETRETVHGWLNTTLEPFFVGSAGTFDYDGTLSLFEATGS